jgi:tripartite-type tricarboxylate transporter receptor subunit TctC
MSHDAGRAFSVAVVLHAALAAPAAAAYPEKPIRLLTPFSAGSVTDMVARPLATKLTEAWGQPVVVDNRTGAGGSIAAEFAAKATPDGHTLLIGANGPTVINPALIKNLPYDSRRAFAPITLTATNNLLMAVPVSLPVKSVGELIALAREKPGQLRYGSPGTGSSPHLS